MTIKLIYEKVKELKKIIINMVQEVVEPSTWNEFSTSLDLDQMGIYRILENDLPVMRDLKAFLNMLTAIEGMAEKMTTRYGLWGASLGFKIMILQDLKNFSENFKVYRSTNSIVTKYIAYLKDVSLTVVLPEIIARMRELGRLCTSENLDKAAEFIIEQVISLEQYQYNYLQRKQIKTAPVELTQEKKEEQREDFITTMVKKNDQYLRSIYKEKYDIHFLPEGKVDDKKIQVLDYYPDNKKDTDIIKNLKLLSNSIIGIKKILDDHGAYQQSSIGVVYIPSFVKNLHRVYTSLSEFDYQAIIAEKSTPFTDEIKIQLSKLNDLLEKLACIADQFELELRLKEGTLLNKVNLLIDRHNQIMSELRILTNYMKQKHIYHKARLTSRQNILSEIDEQIKKLQQFLAYKNHALINIPYVINNAIQAYITKYYDEICMDRNHLDKYQNYLNDAIENNKGVKSFLISQVEYVANYYGYTIQAEFMTSLYHRLLYLQKQKLFITSKNDSIIAYHHTHPYDNVSLNEVSESNPHAVILRLLKNRSDELGMESEKLMVNAVMKKEIKPVAKDGKTESKEVEKKIDKDKTKIRLFNQIQLKNKEQAFFSELIKTFEANQVIPTMETISKEQSLSSKSFMLLYELNEVNKLPEKKLASL